MNSLLHRHTQPSTPQPPVVPPLPRQTVPAASAAVISRGRPGPPGRSVPHGCFSCPWCGALRALVLAEPGATPAPIDSPETQAWITAGSFLSSQSPILEKTRGLSAYGTILPSVNEPSKPDGELAT